MKVHSTNYFNTFIIVAEDCPVSQAELPPVKENNKTIANMQYEMISKNPYKYTSDDVLFSIYAERNDISREDYDAAREQFFSKGQPCFRSSPLTKRYGWGVHYNADGKMALFASQSQEYIDFKTDKSIKVLKAMKSRR